MQTVTVGALPPQFRAANGVEYIFQQERYDIYEKDAVPATGGAYYLYDCDETLNTAFYLKDLRDVTLDFGGARLILHGRIAPFIIDGCENVTVQNVTVEYDRAFYSEFDILENRGGEIVLAKKDKFPCRVENGYLIPYSDTWENRSLHIGDLFVQGFDSATGEGRGLLVGAIGEQIVRMPSPPCEVQHLRVREESGRIVLVGRFPAGFKTGVTLALAHEPRDKNSVFLYHAKNIVIRNYRILNGGAMGIAGVRCENLTLDGVRLFRDALSHGVVTNMADAVHLVGTSGVIDMRNCVFESMIDDAINVHGHFFEITEVADDGVTVVTNLRSHLFTMASHPYLPGDRISINKGHSIDARAEYTVAGEPRTLDRYHLFVPTGEKPDAAVGDIIENLSAQARLHIQNCRFGKANSHLRVQTRGKSLIEHSTIELPLLLTGDTDYWFESSPVNDLTVSHCQFRGERGYIGAQPEVAPTEAHPYYHSGLTVRHCTFDRAIALDAYLTEHIAWSDNTLTGGGVPEMLLRDCGDVQSEP